MMMMMRRRSELLLPPPPPPEEGAERDAHLQEARYDVRQQLMERLLADAFDGLRLHLDGGEVDGVVGRLHDGTQDLDALLRVDGARQRGGCLLRRPDHLSTVNNRVSQSTRAPTCEAEAAPHLLVRVFVRLQRLHDGELGVVLEAGRLVPQDLLHDPQRQGSDGVLREEESRLKALGSDSGAAAAGAASLRLCLPASPAAAAAWS